MAWNDPNDKDRDPWGGRRNDQGPPDLDEVVRKMQEKLGGLFGGRPSSNRTVSDKTPPGMWLAIVAVAVVALLYSMFYRIESAERGVVLRFGRYVTILQPGPHLRFPPPIETVIPINIDQFRSFTVKASMLTKDENIVALQMAIQYRIKDVKNYLLKTADPDESVQRAAESSIREIVGTSTFDFVITEGRAEIASKAVKLIQGMLDNYGTGVEVTSVNMESATAPEEVKSAFDDAIKSREDKERKINEAEAYRNEIVERSQGDAARIGSEAAAYKDQVVARAEGDARRFEQLLIEFEKAPVVTRKRLYLETLEDVLSRTSKVVVDAQGTNSLFYLPLDKLIDNAQAEVPAGTEPEPVSGNYIAPEQPISRDRVSSRVRSVR